MSKYTEILEKVQGYLQDNNNPELKEGEITLYDLYSIVDETTKELYKEKEGEELLHKVNKENSIVKNVGRLFKKKEICDRYTNILFSLDKEDVNMCFYGGFYSDSNFDVYLDSESGELYTRRVEEADYKKEILDKHYDEILDILTSLEEYRKLTGLSETYGEKEEIRQVIDDGFMKATIKLSYFGFLTLDIGISNSVDPDEVAQRDYYGKERIQSVINSNRETVAKNIVFDENELTSDYKKILNRRKKRKEDDK